MLGTKNLSLSVFLGDNQSTSSGSNVSIPSPLGVNDTGTQNTPIDQVQNIEGVGKGELRSAREVRVLRQFYGDGYFGLGASHLPPIDTSVQATDEAYSRLKNAVHNHRGQLTYRHYSATNRDQFDELQQFFGGEMTHYPNLRTAVRDINLFIEASERVSEIIEAPIANRYSSLQVEIEQPLSRRQLIMQRIKRMNPFRCFTS